MCWEGEVAVTMSTLSLVQPVIEFPAVWKTDSGALLRQETGNV